ncbi:acid phosphatase [Gracilinema caldarium]|uniref:Autotransporter-associated beta strand repeat protein n=1 Tax=Gracilinema caldarium (strain ATCC 51460 / DSM 7334 / H1) TaxID=744872 RepID=F8F425_GRAC1|nr:phosphatase PAP2 family protein [Gracilinema caldarium]AEJ20044.1 autotransporter-associated beta strand repeat protein [Gracilinema caldarium DSM 7334]
MLNKQCIQRIIGVIISTGLMFLLSTCISTYKLQNEITSSSNVIPSITSSNNFRSEFTVPPEPVGVGYEDSVPIPEGIPAYVDYGATNQRGLASMATLETNAGVRVLAGMLSIWAPRPAADGKVYVDAGVTTNAEGPFTAITPSVWSGIPGDSTDGTILDRAIHDANIAYVEKITLARTAEQELAAYLDDRRGKSISISDALGPLAKVWLEGTRQWTTITGIPSDAKSVKYDDKGVNRGISSDKGNTDLGKAVDLLNINSVDASTEPAKRYYKYARPYRWSKKVIVAPSLVPAQSSSPSTDGGFPSGHVAEAWRDALTVAWLIPQRFQEMVTRAYVMGENRMLAGVHSPLDVIGGRILALAQVAYNMNKSENMALAAEAYMQTQKWLMTKVGASNFNQLYEYAHTTDLSKDPYADRRLNKITCERLFAPGFTRINILQKAATVPKGAEVLLSTRFPYLTDTQRRAVLKSTAYPAGYPIMDDTEGWGRINLFSAADGYGAFDGDVDVTMNASLGGFNSKDSWRNNITGKGKLTKRGTGILELWGTNSYTGGTVVIDGVLRVCNQKALGSGDVFLKGGTIEGTSFSEVEILGSYVQTGGVLKINLDDHGNGQFLVKGTVFITNGKLSIKFTGKAPAQGTLLNVIITDNLLGHFDEAVVEGYPRSRVLYTSKGLSILVE